MQMQRYRMTWSGVSPLMMNRYMGQEAQKQRTTAEKKLNERESGRWTEKVYWSDALKCVAIPAVMIEACLKSGASLFKLGKKVAAVVFVEGDEVPLHCKGELITKVEENGQIQLDGRGVVIMKRRVDRFRPFVRDWSLSFTVAVLDDAAVNANALEQIAASAGTFCGLGDFRPRFGRFNATVEKI